MTRVALFVLAAAASHLFCAILQMALTVVLLPPILAVIIYILRVASPYMPLYLWAFVFALQLVMMTVYPTLIAPLFNKYAPLEAGSLRDGIEQLAGSLSFPLKKLFVVDGSKRSGHSNAYMYGFGKNKRIVLYDTLLDQCDEKQVCDFAAVPHSKAACRHSELCTSCMFLKMC